MLGKRSSLQFFDRPLSFLLILISLPLLFLPKINLLSLSAQESAGIRIDDLVLLFFGALSLWAHFLLKKKSIPLERWVIFLVLFSLFSFMCNRLLVAEGTLHVDASLFYCFRMAEYFLFFYIGVFATQFFRLSSIIKAFFLWNMLLMILQKIGIIGSFSTNGYTPHAMDRVSGISSFPSEAGMLLNMAFCFFIYDENSNRRLTAFLPPNTRAFFKQTSVYWLFLLFTTLIIITGSRIAIVALIIAFLFRIKKDLSRRSIASWMFGGIFLCAGIYVTYQMIQVTSSISTRSAGLLSFQNFDLAKLVWDQIDLSVPPLTVEAVSAKNYDMSWWMRIHKWCYALKMYVTHPECYLQGIGPGFAKAALDGGYLRILTEYGLLGCFIFWNFFSIIYKQSQQLRWMIIAFAINMIFFDVYLAYKPMSVLFFVSGYTYCLHQRTCSQDSVFIPVGSANKSQVAQASACVRAS